MPFTSQQLHEMLGQDGRLFGQQVVEEDAESRKTHLGFTYKGETPVGHWTRSDIPVGRVLPAPQPLFKKLDPSIVEDELARLGK